jgi:arylformamidase
MADKPVYKQFSEDELNAQYDQATAVPDHSEYTRQWRELSDAACQRYPMQADLSYGPGKAYLLDYFAPTEEGAPLAVFFHGGWWENDKSLFRYPALSLLPNGFAFATANCHQASDVTLSVQVEQARDAVAWLIGEADNMGFDPKRICLIGHGSGAYLAAMLATTNWKSRLGVGASPIRAGLLASGIYDLEPVQLTHINDHLHLTAKEAYTLSPIHCIGTEPCPLVIAWAENDQDEFRRQSRDFAAAWRRHEGACNAFELPATNHFDLSLEYCDPNGSLVRALQAAIDPPEPVETVEGDSETD